MIADFLLFVYLSFESTTTKTTPIPIPNPERPIHHDHTTSRRRRRRRRRRLAWMLLGLIGDGSMYVSFIIECGTWRFACVVMIDVVVELEMLVIADVLLLFCVFVFRIHPYHKPHQIPSSRTLNLSPPHHVTTTTTMNTTTTTTLGMDAASWLLWRWQSVRIFHHRARHMAFWRVW